MSYTRTHDGSGRFIKAMVVLEDGAILESTEGFHHACDRWNISREKTGRRLACRRQGRCLDVAMKRKWDGLSCNACPIRDPMTTTELTQDMHAMADMFDAAITNEEGEYRTRKMPSTWLPADSTIERAGKMNASQADRAAARERSRLFRLRKTG